MTLLVDLLPAYRDYLQFERDLAATTRYCYTSDLRGLAAFLGDKPIAAIDRDDLRAYMRSLSKRKFKANTIRRVIAGFSTFWTWLVLEKHVSENVSQHIQLPRKNVVQPRWMDETDLRAFATACEAAPERVGLAFLLLAFTGMRPAELRALRVADLNLETGSITVRNTKSRRDRVLPIPEHLQPRIAALVNTYQPSHFVFGAEDRIWHRGKMNEWFLRLLGKAGLEGRGYTMYVLRHSVGTLLALNAVPPMVIRDYLGHANITTTNHYLHAAGVDLKRALASHPLMGKTQ